MVALYFTLIGARIRAQMQYRVSFWLDMLGFALFTGLEFAAIAVLVTRFDGIVGWSVSEMMLLYGLSNIAFGISEMVGRGFDAPFESLIISGGFDGILSRPLGSFFQILSGEFQLRRLGRIGQASLILGYGLSQSPISWSLDRVLLLPLTIASGSLIFMGLTIIGATVTFWTIKTPEAIHILTSGGVQLGSYPLNIYQRALRTLFLFILPVGFASYPAAIYLLGKIDPLGLPFWSAWLSPLVAGVFFWLTLQFWRFGVSHYTSSGS